MKFKESELAHELLDGKLGIEIGAAAHNPFNIPNCKFVDRTDDPNDVFKVDSHQLCGEIQPVDFVMDGDNLWMFPDNTWDYVLSSHVLEHFFDPIKAIKEWFRVIKPGGLIFMIVPKARAIPEEDRPPTRLTELLDRHEGRMTPEQVNMGSFQNSSVSGQALNELGHWSVWDLKDFIPLCYCFNWIIETSLETDDKVGNGFCVVLRK